MTPPLFNGPDNIQSSAEFDTTRNAIDLAGAPLWPKAPSSSDLDATKKIDWKAVGKKILSALAGAAIGVGITFLLASNPIGWSILATGVGVLLANLIHSGILGDGQREVLSNLKYAAMGTLLGAGVSSMPVIGVPMLNALVAATPAGNTVSISASCWVMMYTSLFSGAAWLYAAPVPFKYSQNEDSTTMEKINDPKSVLSNLKNLVESNQGLKSLFENQKPTDIFNDIIDRLEDNEIANAQRKGWTLAKQLDLSTKQLTFLYEAALAAHKLAGADKDMDLTAIAMLEFLIHYNKKATSYHVALALIHEDRKEFAEAKKSMEEAIDLQKEAKKDYLGNAIAYARICLKNKDDNNLVKRELEEAFQKNPKSSFEEQSTASAMIKAINEAASGGNST